MRWIFAVLRAQTQPVDLIVGRVTSEEVVTTPDLPISHDQAGTLLVEIDGSA
jgi:hypothetical protein